MIVGNCDPVKEEAALERIDLHLHADRAPLRFDQPQDVDMIRCIGGDHIDLEADLPTARQGANAIRTALVAELVKQLVRLVGIERDVLGGELLVVVGRAGKVAELPGLALTEQHRVDDLLSVHAQRQSDAEILLVEQRTQLGILVREVEVDGHVLAATGIGGKHVVVATLLVFGKQRPVGDGIDVPQAEVDIAADHREDETFYVL